MENTIINEFMPQQLITKVSGLAKSYDITDNNQKIDMLIPAFKAAGFVHCGSGTNRIVFFAEKNPNIVFKVALDERGIDDNNSEYELSGDQFLSTMITITHETNGLVAIADRAYTFTSDDFNDNSEAIFKILKNIANYYLLDDVGPKSFMNWGYQGNNEICLLDYAYLVPIEGVDFTCRSCQGDIIYSDDYTGLECKHCKRKYTVSDLYHEKDEMHLKFQGVTVASIDDDDDDFKESRKYVNRKAESFNDDYANATGGDYEFNDNQSDDTEVEYEEENEEEVVNSTYTAPSTGYTLGSALNNKMAEKLQALAATLPEEQEVKEIKAPTSYMVNGVTIEVSDEVEPNVIENASYEVQDETNGHEEDAEVESTEETEPEVVQTFGDDVDYIPEPAVAGKPDYRLASQAGFDPNRSYADYKASVGSYMDLTSGRKAQIVKNTKSPYARPDYDNKNQNRPQQNQPRPAEQPKPQDSNGDWWEW